MISRLRILVFIAIGITASAHAWGRAFATVMLNGSTFVQLSSTGFAWNVLPRQQVVVPAGTSKDLDYTWMVSVSDSGLPATFDGPFDGSVPTPTDCLPISGPPHCGLPPTGFEQMEAVLLMGFMDPRVPISPFVHVTSTGVSQVDIRTNGDAAPDATARSGHLHIHIEVDAFPGFEESLSFTTIAGAWGYANPIPEPEIYGMMLAGLGCLAVALRRRRRGITLT